ncbi:MAG: hypothetical protein Q7K42_05065, partial [Candidatus Diapherotrites archaeon]|nr:hypothetical protein [Candidatus Diapherotrites archaeon]
MEFIRKTSRRILDFVLSPRKEIAKLRAKKFIEQHPVEPMPKNLAKHILTIPELNALNVDVILTHVMTNPG